MNTVADHCIAQIRDILTRGRSLTVEQYQACLRMRAELGVLASTVVRCNQAAEPLRGLVPTVECNLGKGLQTIDKLLHDHRTAMQQVTRG